MVSDASSFFVMILTLIRLVLSPYAVYIPERRFPLILGRYHFFIGKVQHKNPNRCTDSNQYAGIGCWSSNQESMRAAESGTHSERTAQLLGKAEQADQIQGVYRSHDQSLHQGKSQKGRCSWNWNNIKVRSSQCGGPGQVHNWSLWVWWVLYSSLLAE